MNGAGRSPARAGVERAVTTDFPWVITAALKTHAGLFGG